MENFQPLLGSGFDALAAQHQFYDSLNRGIEEGNIVRATEAQDKLNRYQFAVSEAQRQDAARQAAFDEAAKRSSMDAAQRRADLARSDYQFGVNTALHRRAEDINAARYKFAEDKAKEADRTMLDTVDNTAKFLSPDVNDYGSKVEDSFQKFQDAQARMTTLASELEKDLPPGKAIYNPHVMEFIPTKSLIPATEAENKKISEANAQINNAKAVYQAAATTYQTHLNAFDTLQKQASQNGLVVTKENGKWVIKNPRPGFSEKSYAPPTGEVVAPPAAGVPDTTTTPPNPFAPEPNIMNPDATLGTGTGGYNWGTGTLPTLPVAAPTKQWTRDANGKLVLVQ
jgi:hypothetical protein